MAVTRMGRKGKKAPSPNGESVVKVKRKGKEEAIREKEEEIEPNDMAIDTSSYDNEIEGEWLPANGKKHGSFGGAKRPGHGGKNIVFGGRPGNDGGTRPDVGGDQRNFEPTSREEMEVNYDEHHVSNVVDNTSILEQHIEEEDARTRTNQAGDPRNPRVEEQEKIPLFFPRESNLKTQSDRRLWAANLAQHHPDYDANLRGKNTAHITVRGEEAVTLLTSTGYAGVVMERKRETVSLKKTKVIVEPYDINLPPGILEDNECVEWATRRYVKGQPVPQVLALVKGVVPPRLAVRGNGFRPVRRFIDEAAQCANCWRYGHKAWRCEWSSRCKFCSKSHHSQVCRRRIDNNIKVTPRCCNCRLEHNANSRQCGRWQAANPALSTIGRASRPPWMAPSSASSTNWRAQPHASTAWGMPAQGLWEAGARGRGQITASGGPLPAGSGSHLPPALQYNPSSLPPASFASPPYDTPSIAEIWPSLTSQAPASSQSLAPTSIPSFELPSIPPSQPDGALLSPTPAPSAAAPTQPNQPSSSPQHPTHSPSARFSPFQAPGPSPSQSPLHPGTSSPPSPPPRQSAHFAQSLSTQYHHLPSPSTPPQLWSSGTPSPLILYPHATSQLTLPGTPPHPMHSPSQTHYPPPPQAAVLDSNVALQNTVAQLAQQVQALVEQVGHLANRLDQLERGPRMTLPSSLGNGAASPGVPSSEAVVPLPVLNLERPGSQAHAPLEQNGHGLNTGVAGHHQQAAEGSQATESATLEEKEVNLDGTMEDADQHHGAE